MRNKKSSVSFHINHAALLKFRHICVDKEISVADAMRKLIYWTIEKETGQVFDIVESEKTDSTYKKYQSKMMEERVEKIMPLYVKKMKLREISRLTEIPLTSVVRIIKKIKNGEI